MLVDLFTYNERIKKYVEATLQVNPHEDKSEGDNFPCFSFKKINPHKLDFSVIEKLVSVADIRDIREFGGYELKDSETGEFLRVMKSAAEISAATRSADN